VHEHILAAIVADDEAEAFLAVEEFDHARALADHLRGHRGPGRTAAAKSAAATAAEAIAATAEAVTAASEARRPAEPTEILATAEIVAPIPSTPAAIAAAPFIKSHAR
jgi:hypothetical protein